MKSYIIIAEVLTDENLNINNVLSDFLMSNDFKGVIARLKIIEEKE